jgi:hypothetical protein
LGQVVPEPQLSDAVAELATSFLSPRVRRHSTNS